MKFFTGAYAQLLAVHLSPYLLFMFMQIEKTCREWHFCLLPMEHAWSQQTLFLCV
jgi:hypothetical protein